MLRKLLHAPSLLQQVAGHKGIQRSPRAGTAHRTDNTDPQTKTRASAADPRFLIAEGEIVRRLVPLCNKIVDAGSRARPSCRGSCETRRGGDSVSLRAVSKNLDARHAPDARPNPASSRPCTVLLKGLFGPPLAGTLRDAGVRTVVARVIEETRLSGQHAAAPEVCRCAWLCRWASFTRSRPRSCFGLSH
jgi:hypothetical protein